MAAMKNYFLLIISLLILISCGSDKKDVTVNAGNNDTTITGKNLSELNKKIENNPGNAQLLHQRARLYIEEKNYNAALSDMEKVMALDTSHSEYYLTMADLSFAANRSFQAKEQLEKAIALDSTNSEAMMRLAELYLIVRQYGKSVELLSNILRKDKNNTTAWLMRGINFKENGDTARAVNDFRSAIEADPNYYDAYMQLGIIYQLKNNPISEGYFTNAIKIRPKSEEALYGRALWYQEHNELDKAIQDYTSIVLVNPKNKNAHFNLGYIHQMYLKVYPEAIKHYGNAILADNSYAEAYYNRALCYESVGNLQSAASDFKTAISLRPNYTVAEEGLRRVSK
jgi:tetratricopeptide (TPR) repeat protein